MLSDRTTVGCASGRPDRVVVAVQTGATGSPVYTKGPAWQSTVVTVPAAAREKVLLSSDPRWFASPAKDPDAVAVPTSVLSAYVGVTVLSRPPAPVTFALHGAWAEPS